MSDLSTQLRAYYDATTTETDVDSILVEKGSVLVGPFPEATRRRGVMGASHSDSDRRWWRRPGGVFGIAAAVVLVAVTAVIGAVSLGGSEELGGEPGPAEVLEAFRVAYNDGDVDRLMALFAEDATMRGHPMWLPTLNGTAEIRDVEERALKQSAEDGSENYVDVEVVGNTVTFGHRWVNDIGGCFAGSGHEVTVENGLITHWEWGTHSQPCE